MKTGMKTKKRRMLSERVTSRRVLRKELTFKQHLDQLRHDIFDAAFDPDICGFMTINDLATVAGLCWSTVDNFYRGQTKEPRHSTVFKLCKAIKMDYRLVKEAEAATRG